MPVLTFGAATSNNVVIADSVSTDISSGTSFTWIAWHYPTTQTSGRRIFAKTNTPVTTEAEMHWWASDTNDFQGTVGRVTSNAGSNTTGVNVPLNAWHYVCMTYDESAGVHIYVGNLTTNVAEAAYSGTPAVGSGATVDMNSAMTYGGDAAAFNLAYQGRIGFFGMWNRVLTLGEMLSVQFGTSIPSGNVVLHYVGYNGQGTQIDFSGNLNHGTVGGATSTATEVPIGFPHFHLQSLGTGT